MRFVLLIALLALLGGPALAEDDPSKLAEKLSNPVSNLISLPFQFNYDCCYGPKDADRLVLNIQPVIPIKLNANWNVIVRTILPVIDQEETAPGLGSHVGLGDVTQSFFFSPNPAPGGFVWGVGPVFLWPLATDPAVGSREWGAGPTAVLVKQQNGWTYGILANHIWSYAGEAKRPNVSDTLVQPFLGYTWPDTTGVSLNSEASYDWIGDQWSVPLNLSVSHIFKLGSQATSFQLGARWYPATVEDGPRWGLRFNVVFLFPNRGPA
ncbi:MAG: hypothetical protein WDM86_16930 [Rhizomicrobium sp.]